MSRWYSDEYQANAYGSSAGRVQRLMHASLERGYSSAMHFGSVLELGGNVGEHIPFVRHDFDKYTLTDLHDNLDPVRRDQLAQAKVEFQVADACDLPFGNETFDRVLNTCLLHHVVDPEKALEEMRRVLGPDGVCDIFLSCDPGLLFRLGRQLGPARQARKAGLAKVKRLVDARDHIHHVGGIRRLIQHVFRRDEISELSFPIPFMTWNSSLWIAFRVQRSGS